MPKLVTLILLLFSSIFTFSQKIETVFLDAKDSTTNWYIAVVPESGQINAFQFFLDGFGNAPNGVLIESDLPGYAAQKNILTIIPVLKTGALYFGSDSGSQASLKGMIEYISDKYHLQGKDFYIGGFSIGGTCAVKYAELAVQKNYLIKPKAVFAIDPPLDWERFYISAQRIVRLSDPAQVNPEVTYMITRIKKEMNGTPETALENYYNNAPYSFSDTTQRAIKSLVNTPIRIIAEPDIQWWLANRGYDYSYINIADHAAMINELRRLGNTKAVLITTADKGYRKQSKSKHPHSLSIADPAETVGWLLEQK